MNDKKELNVLVGANIRKEREKAGFTQDQFSEMIGIGPKSLSADERGVVGISLYTLRKICTTLSISADSIIFGDRNRNDVDDLSERLALLPPKQYKIASEVLYKLLEAFALEK